ncbi:MAG: tyrosine-type recombinase/integrase [Bacillota bacterium]
MKGHVEPAGKGKWRVVIEVGRDPSSGKRKRIVRRVEGRKADAEELLTQLLTELKQGTYVEPNKITVAEWLNTWLHEYKRLELRPTTWESYEVIIRNHLVPAVGALLLQDLRPEHLQKLYNEKADAGLSAQTIHHIHKVIHGALKQAVKNKLVRHNVSEAVTLPRIKRREIKTLTPEEQARFLEVLVADRLGPAFLLLLGTGMRRGELLGLRWQDVDLDEGTVCIRRELVWTKEGPVLQEPKTEKSHRLVPLPVPVWEALRRHKARMEAEGNYGPSAFVFCTSNGNYIIPRNFNRKFYELCRKAGIEGVNLHALRHTFATRLLEQGENIKVVQELLGHSKISTTADIYSHVVMEVKRQAVSRLDNLLSDGTKMAPKTSPGTDADAGNP